MSYELSIDAIGDIDEIIEYTLERWGEDGVDKYVGKLKLTLDAIGRGAVIRNKPLDEFPDLYLSRFRYHFNLLSD